MLEGQVAGLMSTPTNGAPGAPAKMRGSGVWFLSGKYRSVVGTDGMILEGNDIPKDFEIRIISMNCRILRSAG